MYQDHVLYADHVTLPAIKPSKQQFGARGPASNSRSPEPFPLSRSTSPAQPCHAGVLHQSQDFLQLPARQHKTVPACAVPNPSTGLSTAATPAGACAGVDHHMLATRLLHASTRNSRASTSSRRQSSSTSSRPRTQQQREEPDEDTISAQQQLEQLYGHSSNRPELEAAAAARILALPFAICSAADGSLFEVATG